MPGEEYAMRWLLARGYKPFQAAAIVGHGIVESGLRPSGAVGDNGTSFGAFQWHGPRAAALQQYAAQTGQDWQSLDTQLGFLDHELNTTEKRAGDALRASADVRGATRAMMDYERPAGYTPANPEAGAGYANRLSQAFRLAGVEPTPGVGDRMPQSVGLRVAALQPAGGVPALTPGALAMQFMAQTETDAKEKKAQAEAEAARRRALFGVPPGGIGSMFG